MFERLSNGWTLAKYSWRVLKLDKEMLVFPFLSGIACLLILASFALPLVGSDELEILMEEKKVSSGPLALVFLFLFYFATYFVVIFFNAALISCAVIRFNGGDPTVGDGLKAASVRLPQILRWALVSASVGLILRLIESRSKIAGKIAAALVGTAWGIATYFVLPVLVVEGVGPLQAIERSTEILCKTWGEALGANFSIGFIVFIAVLVALIPAVVSGGAVVGIGITVTLWILISLVAATLDAITLGALYVYAAEGRVPSIFDRSSIESAFGGRAD